MAASASLAGYGGSVSGPTGVTEVKNWKCDLKTAKLDATSMDSAGWEEFIAGLQGGSGSFTSGGTVAPTRGLSAATMKTKSTGGMTLTGSIFLERATVNVPVDGSVSYDCEFSWSGSIAIT
jgi:hypothetical protein